jgi:hypothetical protein
VYALEYFTRVLNVTTNSVIYNPEDDNFGATLAVENSETTITLRGNTSYCSSSDRLQIIVNETTGAANSKLPTDLYGALDAFGRQRVSELYTIADYKTIYGINTDFLTSTVGGGSSVAFAPDLSATLLTLGSNSGDRVTRQSRMYHSYQPGKSQLNLFSFVFGATVTNVSKKVGLFDDTNGVYFQLTGSGVKSMVLRSNIGGVFDEVIVPQTDWNVDPCDGTGPSGFNIDTTKTQLWFADFQWLGVGRVRTGFVHNGIFIVAHEFYHSNILSTAYWSLPSLPLRAEMTATGTPGATATMYIICGTVATEGGYVESGSDFSRATALRAVGDLNATLPMMAIRVANTFNSKPNRITVRPGPISCVSPVSGVRIDFIRLDSQTSVTGGNWVADNVFSGVEYNVTPTGYSAAANDEIMSSFFIPAGQGNNAPGLTDIAIPVAAKKGFIAQNIASTDSQAFLIRATSLGSNATCAAAFQWREIT